MVFDFKNENSMNLMNKTLFSFSIAFACLSLLNCKQETATPSNQTPVVTQPEDPNIGCTDAVAKNYKSTAKEDDCSCQYDFSSKISTKIPAEFTRKVLIEEHTGTWCGWCPLANETMGKLTSTQKVIGVGIHYNDEMAAMDKVFNPLKSKYGYPAFPSGMVNRRKSIAGTTFIMGEQEWKVNVDDILQNPKSTTGLAIESSVAGKEITVLAHVSVKTATTDVYGIGMYLVENDVAGYPQANYASRNQQFAKYEAFNLPTMINDIKHKNVARDAVAPLIGGYEIPAAALQKGKTFRKLFKITIPSTVLKPENLRLVGFITNRKDNQIINAQEVAVGAVKDWE